MVVGISLLTLVPGVVGGSETYVRELCRALARVGTLEYRAYVPTIADDAADGLPSRTVPEYRAGRTMPARIRAMALAAARPRRVGRALELERLDAIHFPLSVMLPPVDAVPAVSSVLDVQHEVFPQFFSRAERTYRRLVYGWTVRRSRLVITISEHAARKLVERLGMDEARVRAIHLGIDHERFRPGDEPREEFLLYPALGWPHKNHARLFEAFALLRRRRPELRLVLTGYTGDAPEGVDVRGRVSAEELADLYRRAAALVFPSLYEGFGQPPLEAMASGCPVACSTGGSLPEVVGDAARLFDPMDAEDMAAAVEDVLDEPQPWVERGLARAARFTWDDCARRHEAVYRELLSS
ncbi:MAG: glycosyltransferase family 4 protein [Actinomycetota bacterium]|nr:glycosyltransferase family 4 protein [Actinomycetota bacterium]